MILQNLANSPAPRPSPSMLAALRLAGTQGELRRIHDDKPGAPPWPAPPASLHALVRRGWLEQGERRNKKGWLMTTWTITETGRLVLDPPPVVHQDRPRYLAPVTGTTGDARRSFDYEWGVVTTRQGFRRLVRLPVEHVDPDTLDHLPARIRHEEANPTRRRRAA